MSKKIFILTDCESVGLPRYNIGFTEDAILAGKYNRSSMTHGVETISDCTEQLQFWYKDELEESNNDN